MSKIRRSTLISSFINYVGFLIGILNVYIFTNIHYFTPEQYGLSRFFIDLTLPYFALSNLGMFQWLLKLTPMYKRIYPQHSNTELLKQNILVTILGFSVLSFIILLFKQIILQFLIQKSPLIVEYFYWIFPFMLGTVLFMIFEYYLYSIEKAILLSIFKEIIQRLIVFALLLCVVFNFINISSFIKLYALSPLILFIIFILYYFLFHKIPSSPIYSRLSSKLKKQRLSFMLFNFGATSTIAIAYMIDSFFLATVSKNGLSDAGVFTFASFIISFMQVPQKYLNNISSVKIIEAIQLKNMNEVHRIYYRASLNLFIFGLIVLLSALLVFDNIFQIKELNINPIYQNAKLTILILGTSKLFDMLTSVNNYIIIGSKHWKWDLYSNILLLFLVMPLNYFLIKHYGIIGAAMTNLLVMFIINSLRCGFIYVKFKIHPFKFNFVWIFIFSLMLYFSLSFIDGVVPPILLLIFKPLLFSFLFLSLILIFKLTPDLQIILHSLKQRAFNLLKK